MTRTHGIERLESEEAGSGVISYSVKLNSIKPLSKEGGSNRQGILKEKGLIISAIWVCESGVSRGAVAVGWSDQILDFGK